MYVCLLQQAYPRTLPRFHHRVSRYFEDFQKHSVLLTSLKEKKKKRGRTCGISIIRRFPSQVCSFTCACLHDGLTPLYRACSIVTIRVGGKSRINLSDLHIDVSLRRSPPLSRSILRGFSSSFVDMDVEHPIADASLGNVIYFANSAMDGISATRLSSNGAGDLRTRQKDRRSGTKD